MLRSGPHFLIYELIRSRPPLGFIITLGVLASRENKGEACSSTRWSNKLFPHLFFALMASQSHRMKSIVQVELDFEKIFSDSMKWKLISKFAHWSQRVTNINQMPFGKKCMSYKVSCLYWEVIKGWMICTLVDIQFPQKFLPLREKKWCAAWDINHAHFKLLKLVHKAANIEQRQRCKSCMKYWINLRSSNVGGQGRHPRHQRILLWPLTL